MQHIQISEAIHLSAAQINIFSEAFVTLLEKNYSSNSAIYDNNLLAAEAAVSMHPAQVCH